jgi:hypothetical protein
MSRRKWMAVVSLAGLFLGVYLTLYHYGFIGTLACNVSSCEKVADEPLVDVPRSSSGDMGRRLLRADARVDGRRLAAAV